MQHRCERGERCPEYELVDGTRLGRAINSERGLCDSCTRAVQRTLADLPRLYTELNTLLGKGQTAGGEPVSMTRELPVPIRTHIDAVQREIATEACLWGESVADVLRIEWDTNARRTGWLIDRASRMLSSSTSVFLALRDAKHVMWDHGHYTTVARDGLDGALTFLRLSHRARQFAGQTRLVHRLPVPCPRCEAMALAREDGDDTIQCRDCGRAYTWAEYERLCLILVDWRTR